MTATAVPSRDPNSGHPYSCPKRYQLSPPHTKYNTFCLLNHWMRNNIIKLYFLHIGFEMICCLKMPSLRQSRPRCSMNKLHFNFCLPHSRLHDHIFPNKILFNSFVKYKILWVFLKMCVTQLRVINWSLNMYTAPCLKLSNASYCWLSTDILSILKRMGISYNQRKWHPKGLEVRRY
jgi:hypothetical protein